MDWTVTTSILITNDETCPHCGASLQGTPIPEESQHLYGATHFSRKMGVEIPGVYDGVAYWSCPACGMAWERGLFDGHRKTRIARAVADHNKRAARKK